MMTALFRVGLENDEATAGDPFGCVIDFCVNGSGVSLGSTGGVSPDVVDFDWLAAVLDSVIANEAPSILVAGSVSSLVGIN
jgi:hypothetical protein